MDGANYIGVYIMGVTFDTFSTVTFERVKVENINMYFSMDLCNERNLWYFIFK